MRQVLDFVPPRCPNQRCRMHRDPRPGFYRRRGSYTVKCRNHPIPRFRCKVCRRGFSYQTFRADYCDHRPFDNPRLFTLLTSGVGLRQAARVLGMSSGATQRKFRKLGRVLRRLNRNLLTALPAHRTFLLDEIETFEHSSICPVTMAVLIERDSKLIVATVATAIRRRARKGSRRERRLQRHEARHGRRKDKSRLAVRLVLRRWGRLLAGKPATLLTDRKASYATACRRMFGDQVRHERFSSRLPRTVMNPLFPINLTEAMLRDNCGRLRRRSWLVSKQVRYLRRQADLFVAYRNWQRPRTNQDDKQRTPGVVLGLVERALTSAELLAWRQDWQDLSIHPTSCSGAETVLRRSDP